MVKHTQFASKLLTNCLSVFDHFVGLALKGLRSCKNCVSFSRLEKLGFLVYKSVLFKSSSGECAPHNFVLLVTLQGTRVCHILYLIVHQMK